MIRVTDNLHIPEHEVQFTASRSGGPGGQNVNKVSSRVTLSFDVSRSESLSEAQRERILAKLATRINKDGVLRISSQRSRSQDFNRSDALQRFVELLQDALHREKPRVATKATRAAREKRLAAKANRTRIKSARSKKDWDE